MARCHLRFLPLVRRQYLGWGLVSVLPLALCACKSTPNWPGPQVGQETDFSILTSPEREVDILFMVDNSPGMDPKQAALVASFPKMIQVLQQLPDGSGGVSLPDVHIGVVDSDMGAGSELVPQGCKRVLADKGLLWGNDPNNPSRSHPVLHTRNPMGVASIRANAGSQMSRIQTGPDG